MRSEGVPERKASKIGVSYRDDVVQGQDLELKSRKRTSQKQDLGSAGRAGVPGRTRRVTQKEESRTGTGLKAQEGGSGRESRNPRDKKGVKDTGKREAVFQGQGAGIQGTGKCPKAQRRGFQRQEGRSRDGKRV